MKNIKVKAVRDNKEKEHYINDVWDILKKGYERVDGGLHFKSKFDLIVKTYLWKIVLYKDSVIAVTVYKAKKGLKLVALSAGTRFREIAINALKRVIKRDLKYCWMELSEAAEAFVMKVGGDKYILPNSIAQNLLDKQVEPKEDGIHYCRTIKGVRKEKVLIGTVQLF